MLFGTNSSLVEFPASLPRAEGAGVVLAGLQPDSDAVFVDGVGAAQWVAAVWIHVVLTHQAEFTGPNSTCRRHRSLRGRRRPLDGARVRGPADGPRGRPLVLGQLEADLLDDFFHGHAGQRAAGALHLLEQRRQLSPVALWEPSPELLQDFVKFAGGGGSGRGGGRRGGNYRRGRGETGRGSHPYWRSDVGLEMRRRQVERLVLGWERGLELVLGWRVVVAVTVLGMVRGLVLVIGGVSLGRDWKMWGHEVGTDQ